VRSGRREDRRSPRLSAPCAAGEVTNYRVKFEGPAALTLRVATALADADGIELISSDQPVTLDESTIALNVTVEAAFDAPLLMRLPASVARCRRECDRDHWRLTKAIAEVATSPVEGPGDSGRSGSGYSRRIRTPGVRAFGLARTEPISAFRHPMTHGPMLTLPRARAV
jgi:hypothetical protein